MMGPLIRRLFLASIVSLQSSVLSDAFITPLNMKLERSMDLKATRRHILDLAVVGAILLLPTNPAVAAYGESTNLQGFDYIEFLEEKNALVDPSTFLYKGADREIQLERIKDAILELQKIPEIAAAKKWSQVQGILTGPLGTLSQTMTTVTGKEPTAEIKTAFQKVKTDLYAIGTAATKKSDAGCIEATQATLKDLEVFFKASF